MGPFPLEEVCFLPLLAHHIQRMLYGYSGDTPIKPAMLSRNREEDRFGLDFDQRWCSFGFALVSIWSQFWSRLVSVRILDLLQGQVPIQSLQDLDNVPYIKKKRTPYQAHTTRTE